MTISFGTDGWRAVISDEFTFENVRRVAQAIAEVLLENSAVHAVERPTDPPLAVVGFDTRFLSDRYAAAVSEVLAANGLRVALARADAPTPAVSYAIPFLGAVGGIMITASHNPPRYNGIKLKSAFGGSAPVNDTRRVEAHLAANLAVGREPARVELEEAMAQGLVSRFDPFPAYADHLRRLVDLDAIGRARLRIVVDAMYGAGRGYLRDLLAEAGAQVVEIRGEMNPGFNGIHPEPIARHLGPLIEMVPEGGFDLGLATDGDADRIGAVGPSGRFIDPHCIMTLALRYLVEERQGRGAVVKTVSTTQMLNRLAARYGLPLHETPVGFNYIGDLMMSDDVLLGGEESGGISIKGHIPEGDGVLMGLLLAEIVARYGRSPEALLSDIMEQIG
ncbi:MAG: phosphoglucomutase/phosphomannomutase family protein, partial [Anaerolineae bacterium]